MAIILSSLLTPCLIARGLPPSGACSKKSVVSFNRSSIIVQTDLKHSLAELSFTATPFPHCPLSHKAVASKKLLLLLAYLF